MREMHRSRTSESTRSASNARAKNQTVDCVKWKSDALDSIAISAIVGDAWMHHDGPIKIERVKKQENVDPHRGIVAHPTRTIVCIHPIFIRSNGQHFSRRISL